MSHFSTIKTKIKDYDTLVKALNNLGQDVTGNNQELVVSGAHGKGHETVVADIAIGTDIGFRYSTVSQTYELVTDLHTWNQPVPVERFLDKLAQEYALVHIKSQTINDGYEIVEEKRELDGSVELVVTRWTSDGDN